MIEIYIIRINKVSFDGILGLTFFKRQPHPGSNLFPIIPSRKNSLIDIAPTSELFPDRDLESIINLFYGQIVTWMRQ